MDYENYSDVFCADDSLDEATLAEMNENEDDRDGQWYEYSYGSLIDRLEAEYEQEFDQPFEDEYDDDFI